MTILDNGPRTGQFRARAPDMVYHHRACAIPHNRTHPQRYRSLLAVCRSVCKADHGSHRPVVHLHRGDNPIWSSPVSGCVAEVGETRSVGSSSDRPCLPSVAFRRLLAAPSFLPPQRGQARFVVLHFPLVIGPIATTCFLPRLRACLPRIHTCCLCLRIRRSARAPICEPALMHQRGLRPGPQPTRLALRYTLVGMASQLDHSSGTSVPRITACRTAAGRTCTDLGVSARFPLLSRRGGKER